LKKNGFSSEEIERFVQEDNFAIVNAQRYIEHDLELREHMFGYPANMTQDSAMTRYLRRRETELPLMNNCGDPYDAGNYLMDSKGYEQALLSKLFKHFGLDSGKGATPWGYITTGGSESNKWGIHNGLRKFPNGRVYYSQSAHYSVGKSVKIGFDNSKNDITLIKHSEISLQPNSEKIDTDVLLSQIRENWKTNQEPAILLLTSGTTKTGAVDDVEFISKTLKSEGIPHYIHLDAALFGGIAKNQVNAPKAPNFEDLGIDSISVSLHKYFGNHDVKSVVITREMPNAPKVDYIGQYDSTTAGSRTFNPFSSLQRVSETLDRTMPQEYARNVALFESMLKQYNIKYSRAGNSNIFVIDEPSVRISQKYQLSDFEDNGKKKSHIIIFPYHKPKKMLELVGDLIQDIRARN
jgi:histidine decarboxylase